jgi:hypothetical protein
MSVVILNTEKQICRIACKLQESKKPTYLVRELRQFNKQEKQKLRREFTCRLIDQWKTFTLMG